MKTADGLVIGSPVYWASPSGEIVSFMDQLAGKAGAALVHKVGATVASARRAGTTATLDVLNKYLAYHQMVSVASNYWPMVHGNTPDEVRQDAEGLQIMRVLGRNMAWILKCIEGWHYSTGNRSQNHDQFHPLRNSAKNRIKSRVTPIHQTWNPMYGGHCIWTASFYLLFLITFRIIEMTIA